MREFQSRHFRTTRTENVTTRNHHPNPNNSNPEPHRLAGLKCQMYGGPADEYAEKEMVFWSDLPSDSRYKSPFLHSDEERFLTFEPDHGGWNNIRMAMGESTSVSYRSDSDDC